MREKTLNVCISIPKNSEYTVETLFIISINPNSAPFGCNTHVKLKLPKMFTVNNKLWIKIFILSYPAQKSTFNIRIYENQLQRTRSASAMKFLFHRAAATKPHQT